MRGALTEKLTPREREIAGLVCEGLSNKQIAAKLGSCESTVKHQVYSLMDKTGMGSRYELMAWWFSRREESLRRRIAELEKGER
jgi:DNA-binding NarL/FixJ family response regulator